MSNAIDLTRLFKPLLLAFVVLVLYGCSATGPLFDQKEQPAAADGRAVLYVYRTTTKAMGARTASIDIDGKKLGELVMGSYLVVTLDPGTYTLTQRWNAWIGEFGALDKPISVALHLGNGSTSYIRMDTATEFPSFDRVRWSWNLRSVPAHAALTELQAIRKAELETAFRANP
ncbi:DUF2846 domain-containing protein [Pseudorhodoferax sp.]|uniref:DUF2846 domain-containing protein n=1 Tax=Pseudorhodoferax sp. TaxID=1993553 RepID=UPI002DD68306|nr:DUF2846 domain-containing protein [Pseudorhodoferax sp.]